MGCLSFLCPPRLGHAELVVIQPGSAQDGRRIAITFILRSYKLTQQNLFNEVSAPGLPGAPLQFLRGQPRTLSLDIVFDARSQNRDVRELTRDITRLMKIDPASHAPPALRFEWKGVSMRCVLESATDRVVSVFPDGRPARAKVQATFKEMSTLAELLAELNRE